MIFLTFMSVFVELLTNAALTFRKRSEMPMVSAISRLVKLGSLQTISKTCSMISGVVALFGRPLIFNACTTINSKTHRCTVGNEGADSFNKRFLLLICYRFPIFMKNPF